MLGPVATKEGRQFKDLGTVQVVENGVLIATVVFAGWYYGAGLDSNQVSVGLVITLGVGSTVAVALHAALQLLGTAQVGLLSSSAAGQQK